MDTDDVLMLVCAFRYALGRRSYVVGTVVERIIRDWDLLPVGQRISIQGEIDTAIARANAGDFIDVTEWRKITALPVH